MNPGLVLSILQDQPVEENTAFAANAMPAMLSAFAANSKPAMLSSCCFAAATCLLAPPAAAAPSRHPAARRSCTSSGWRAGCCPHCPSHPDVPPGLWHVHRHLFGWRPQHVLQAAAPAQLHAPALPALSALLASGTESLQSVSRHTLPSAGAAAAAELQHSFIIVSAASANSFSFPASCGILRLP